MVVLLAQDPAKLIDSDMGDESIGLVDCGLPSGKKVFDLIIERFLRMQ
jgi:hypothetical protein